MILRRGFGRIKFHKQPLYGAIPYYLKPHYIDPHNYTLRPKEEVMAEWQALPRDAHLKYIQSYHEVPFFKEREEKPVRLSFRLKDYNLTELQLMRLKTLMGVRWRQDSDQQMIKSKHQPTREENALKVAEMFKELMLEAKRAP